MYILELKIWRGDKYHENELVQLAEYLEQYGLEEGYLLIFDFRKVKGTIGKVEEVMVKVHVYKSLVRDQTILKILPIVRFMKNPKK